jgi:hypothetical protein
MPAYNTLWLKSIKMTNTLAYSIGWKSLILQAPDVSLSQQQLSNKKKSFTAFNAHL